MLYVKLRCWYFKNDFLPYLRWNVKMNVMKNFTSSIFKQVPKRCVVEVYQCTAYTTVRDVVIVRTFPGFGRAFKNMHPFDSSCVDNVIVSLCDNVWNLILYDYEWIRIGIRIDYICTLHPQNCPDISVFTFHKISPVTWRNKP